MIWGHVIPAALTLAPSLATHAGAADPAEPLTGETRLCYNAADEVAPNYAPDGNVLFDLQCCGENTPCLERGNDGRPPVFKKASIANTRTKPSRSSSPTRYEIEK